MWEFLRQLFTLAQLSPITKTNYRLSTGTTTTKNLQKVEKSEKSTFFTEIFKTPDRERL